MAAMTVKGRVARRAEGAAAVAKGRTTAPQGGAGTAATRARAQRTGPGGQALAVEPGLREANLKRLRRIEGQVRGISRMVDEDVYCIDVLTQISAATKALQAVALGLVEDHIGHCVVDAARESDEAAQAKVAEASAAIARLVRS